MGNPCEHAARDILSKFYTSEPFTLDHINMRHPVYTLNYVMINVLELATSIQRQLLFHSRKKRPGSFIKLSLMVFKIYVVFCNIKTKRIEENGIKCYISVHLWQNQCVCILIQHLPNNCILAESAYSKP